MSRSVVALAFAAVASIAASPAAAAVTFSFSFTAPFSNGDTGSGSGQLTTGDADASGRYEVQDVTGIFAGYQNDPDPTVLDTASGGLFTLDSAYIYQNLSGAWVTDALTLSGMGGFINFAARDDSAGTYSTVATDFVFGGSATLSLAKAGAVPEPTTWAMLILGFGLTGAAVRRRRHRDAVTA